MPKAPRIDVLVVEDDRPLSELLTRAIRRNDLATDVAGDVLEAKRLLARNQYKVILGEIADSVAAVTALPPPARPASRT